MVMALSYVSSKTLGVADKSGVKKILFGLAEKRMDQCINIECRTESDKNTYYSTMCNSNFKTAQSRLQKKIKTYVATKILKEIQVITKKAKKNRRLLKAKGVVAKAVPTADQKIRAAKAARCKNEMKKSKNVCKRISKMAKKVMKELHMQIPLRNCLDKTWISKCDPEIRESCNATKAERAKANKALALKKQKDERKAADKQSAGAKKVQVTPVAVAVKPKAKTAPAPTAVKPKVKTTRAPAALKPKKKLDAFAQLDSLSKTGSKLIRRRVQTTAASAKTTTVTPAKPVNSDIKSSETDGAKLPESGIKVPEDIEGDGQASGVLLKAFAGFCILLSMYIIN